MLPEKTNISARVEITLKKIVDESSFTYKDAYKLESMLIAICDAQETLTLTHNNPNYERIIKTKRIQINWRKKTGTWKGIKGFIGEPSPWAE